MTTTAAARIEAHAYRVAVDVTTTVAVTAWTMTRSYGGVIEPVRGDGATWSTFVASGNARTLYDVEAPRGVPITYAVSAVLADGTVDVSPASTPVTLDPAPSDCFWWAAPLTLPRLSVTFEPERQSAQDFTAANGVFRATGRADPIVLFGTRQTPAGDLAARCPDYASAETLRANLGGPDVLVIRAPVDAGWSLNGRRYVALDTQRHSRLFSAAVTDYTVDLPWLEVAAPLVPVIGWGAIWDDVPPAFATWADLPTAFANWNALVGWVP